jgi:hypothetical protein
MLKYILLFSIFIVFSPEICYAQRTAVTLSGQNIKQQADGTWKKIIPIATDSSSLITETQSIHDTPFAVGTSENIINNYTLLMKAAQNLEVESFAAVDFMELSIAQNEIILSKAKLSKDKQSINELKSIIKQQIKDKNKAEKSYQGYFEKILEIRNLPSLNASEQEKSIKKISTSLGVTLETKDQDLPINEIAKVSELTGQIQDCKIIRDDVKMKKRVIEIEAKPILSFTPVRLKSYFKEKDLMQAHASFIKIGKDYFLKLTIKLFSKDASKSYGFIAKESMMSIEFITGKKEVLFALDAAPAQFENYTGYTNYNVLYPVSTEILSVMEDVPLNTISLMWSSGYETYDIYEVESLVSQAKCIKSIK